MKNRKFAITVYKYFPDDYYEMLTNFTIMAIYTLIYTLYIYED